MALDLSGSDSDQVFWSWSNVIVAAGSGVGSGVFVGPNILMTASHLGHTTEDNQNPGLASAFFYGEGDQDPTLSFNTPCEFLVQNLGAGDTMLMYCEDVSWGTDLVPPGIILGYADFDLGSVSVNDPVYSFWGNGRCPNAPNPGDRERARGHCWARRRHGDVVLDRSGCERYTTVDNERNG